MATVVDFDIVKKHVNAILMTTKTPYGATTGGNTPDGSNQTFPSLYEINDGILYVDAEICTLICSVLGHPYQTTFLQTSSVLTNGANLPARNGIVTNVVCLSGQTNYTFNAGDVNTTDNVINVGDTSIPTGTRVQFSTTGGLPAPLVAATDYFLNNQSVLLDGYYICSSYANSLVPTPIDLTTTGSGTDTMILDLYEQGIEGESADEMTEVHSNRELFGSTDAVVSRFWKIVGNNIYTSSLGAKVTYTDFTATSSPQCPQPYMWALVSGTIAHLVKDGSDDAMSAYFGGFYAQALQMIAAQKADVPQVSYGQ